MKSKKPLKLAVLCAALACFGASEGYCSPAKAKAAGAKNSAAVKKETEQKSVTVYYFHGDARCSSCRKIEQYTKEAVELNFSSGPYAGRAQFSAVNIDRPENEHFIADYKLVSKAVVLQPEKGGKWVNLDQIWLKLGDRDAFLSYIADGIIRTLEAK